MFNNIQKKISRNFLNDLNLDKKVVTIFLSVAVLQTLSWYFSSKNFFYENLAYLFSNSNFDYELTGNLYWFLSDIILLLVIPVLIIKLFFKENLKDYGFNLLNSKTGIKWILFSFIFFVIVIWFVSSTESFQNFYPQVSSSKENLTIFLIFEISLLIYLFAWEFIWRGFMLFGLEEKFGLHSIFIQMLPFVILHNGKPVLETFASIFGAILLGFLALKTRSYIYGVIIHFLLIFNMDLISLLRYKTGEYETGLNSLLNLILKLLKG